MHTTARRGEVVCIRRPQEGGPTGRDADAHVDQWGLLSSRGEGLIRPESRFKHGSEPDP